MILVVLNYTFLYLDRLFSFLFFFQKQTSLNSCGTISLYEICLNLSFWVTENRINGFCTYNVCGEGILYSVIFYHLLIHQWQSSPDIRQHGNLWLGLLGLQGINWSIDHIRVKLLYITEFIYTFTSCQKKYQAVS